MENPDARSHTHPHSTAKLGGHPIHPMLIPFPIVCFIGVLVTDIVFLNNHDPGWATASRYLLGIGIVLSAFVVLILLYSGWKGGDLVYRHGIGVDDAV